MCAFYDEHVDVSGVIVDGGYHGGDLVGTRYVRSEDLGRPTAGLDHLFNAEYLCLVVAVVDGDLGPLLGK